MQRSGDGAASGACLNLPSPVTSPTVHVTLSFPTLSMNRHVNPPTPLATPVHHSDKVANRKGDRKWPLNDGCRPNFRGVRVALLEKGIGGRRETAA
jgi:hypothetical protein